MIDIQKLYNSRFTTLERIKKNELWRVLCRDFLQQFIHFNDKVVDLGAGYCEFINHIHCGEKIAVDVNLDVKKYANKDIKVVINSVKTLRSVFTPNSLDVIFMSNLLEHLEDKEDVFRLLNEAFQVLKRKGRLLIMQPDIGLVGNDYWDFFDHKVPITYASLVEVLIANKFKIGFHRYPFLPYSTKVRFLPLNPVLLKIYLKLRPLHFLFGKQFFICAVKE